MSLVKSNRLFFPTMDDFFSPDWLGGISNELNTLPAVNIKENEQNFELDLAIPGQKREDFNIELDEHVLTISMEQKSEDETVTDSYTRKEFSYSSFRRSFTMPETIDEGKIDAAYKEGILKITLPKKEEALPKPKRLISIGK
ncbi:MAG: Hsp20/alpha crystallin family protein [Eudoraea sp.]|nr:Hsp20/alpha crystallin family protein [Eudoraea sp.]